ncbi:MAG: glycosyl transferase group 1 [Chthoniobacteraceae bacterium]|nr:glycosyl transferase group 1 [Chthoniobacteraceae bacterium]
MRIAFVYTPGRRARYNSVVTGEVPTEFFYGAVELAAAGHEIERFEFDFNELVPVLPKALDLLRLSRLIPPKLDGWTLLNAWNISPKLNDFDVVVATVGHYGMAFGLCAELGRLKVPLVSIQCGLLRHRYSPWQRHLSNRFLRHCESVFFGITEVEPARADFKVPPSQLADGQFGVDLKFWTPEGEREDYVLAVGSDPQRDYDTLLKAASDIPAPVRIITRLKFREALPDNVTVVNGCWQNVAISDQGIRDLYRRAACVVTSVTDTLQPSGQSVSQQAMACGAPVVLTNTCGLWNPDTFFDGKNVCLVPPTDPAALAAAVRKLLADPALARRIGDAGRESTLIHGNIHTFARQIGDACERAVARGPL